MARDGRVYLISEDGILEAVLFISVGIDKPGIPFKYRTHNPIGTVVQVDGLIAKTWNRKMRQAFTDMLYSEYPNVNEAFWYRPTSGSDRQYRTKRRNSYVSSKGA